MCSRKRCGDRSSIAQDMSLRRLRDFVFDNFLITIFVECWRPEKHMFYLSWGECTINLQYVEYHLRLCVHREPVWMVRHRDVGVGGVTTWCQASSGTAARAQRKESFSLKLTGLRDRV
ncbi:hypothetical protein AHAS_Ahas02G0096800 [Arachis hypogaea]